MCQLVPHGAPLPPPLCDETQFLGLMLPRAHKRGVQPITPSQESGAGRLVDTLQADPRMAAWPQLVSNRPSCTCLQLPAQGQPAPASCPPAPLQLGASSEGRLGERAPPPPAADMSWRPADPLRPVSASFGEKIRRCWHLVGWGPSQQLTGRRQRQPQTPAPPLPSGAAERSSPGGVQGPHLGVSVPGGPLPPAWGEVLGGVSGTQPCSFLGADVCCRRCWSWTRPRRHIRALTPSPVCEPGLGAQAEKQTWPPA